MTEQRAKRSLEKAMGQIAEDTKSINMPVLPADQLMPLLGMISDRNQATLDWMQRSNLNVGGPIKMDEDNDDDELVEKKVKEAMAPKPAPAPAPMPKIEEMRDEDDDEKGQDKVPRESVTLEKIMSKNDHKTFFVDFFSEDVLNLTRRPVYLIDNNDEPVQIDPHESTDPREQLPFVKEPTECDQGTIEIREFPDLPQGTQPTEAQLKDSVKFDFKVQAHPQIIIPACCDDKLLLVDREQFYSMIACTRNNGRQVVIIKIPESQEEPVQFHAFKDTYTDAVAELLSNVKLAPDKELKALGLTGPKY